MIAQLPVSAPYVAAAGAPLALLLVLILVFRASAGEAAGASYAVTLVVAALVFGTPFQAAVVATVKGIWDGIFILFVIWPALVLFEVVDNAGAFDVMREGLERFTRNRLILVLALGWLFASFLQSVAGFGTPIAIIAPVLIGIGVRPVHAVVIPLIGQAWANVFGSLGVPWLTLLRVTSPADPVNAAVSAALIVWVANLLAGLSISWFFGRVKGVLHALPFVAAVSLVHGLGQVLLAPKAPPVTALLPSVVALGLGGALALLPRYKEPDGIETGIMRQSGTVREEGQHGRLTLAVALAPYAVLVALALLVLLIPSIRETLQTVSLSIAVPETVTSFGVTRAANDTYGVTSPLTHPGAFLLIAALVGFVLFKRRGAYGQNSLRDIFGDVARSALPASLSVLALLSLSNVMDAAGMVPLLAAGAASVATPTLYAAGANAIGALGTFMTSSTTASNILFGPLQQGSAVRLGLPTSLVLGAQSAGAGAADAIAPANVALGTGTAKIPGREAEVLERTIPWLLVVSFVMGAVTLAMRGG